MSHFEHINRRNDINWAILPDDILIFIIILIEKSPAQYSDLKNIITLSHHSRELVYSTITPPWYKVDEIYSKLIQYNSVKMFKLFTINNRPINTRLSTPKTIGGTPIVLSYVNTLLSSAVAYRRIEIVRILINDKRFEWDQSYCFALCEACDRGYVKIFNLLHARPEIGKYGFAREYLTNSIEHGSVTIVKSLLYDTRLSSQYTGNFLAEIVYNCKSAEVAKVIIDTGKYDIQKMYQRFILGSHELKEYIKIFKMASEDNRVNMHKMTFLTNVIRKRNYDIINSYASIVNKSVGECFYELTVYKFKKHSSVFSRVSSYIFENPVFDPSMCNYDILKFIFTEQNCTEYFFALSGSSIIRTIKMLRSQENPESKKWAEFIYNKFRDVMGFNIPIS